MPHIQPIPRTIEGLLPERCSPLALGGLVFGIGQLDAEEVLRYMDATFRQRAAEEEEKTK